jgi:hypothetical protein
MNTISHTPHEAAARRLVAKLCRRPAYGLSWRDYAIAEITRALAIAATAARTMPASDQRREAR